MYLLITFTVKAKHASVLADSKSNCYINMDKQNVHYLKNNFFVLLTRKTIVNKKNVCSLKAGKTCNLEKN